MACRLTAIAAIEVFLPGCASSRPTTTPIRGRIVTAAPATSPTTTTAPRSTTTPSSISEPAKQIAFALYFLRGNYLGVARRSMPATPAVGTQAVNALLGGPDQSELAAGLSSAVPAGSKLLGLAISSGTATANFNTAFATPGSAAGELQRVAQVVFTLTQFPAVDRVAFKINGVTPQRFGNGAVDLSRPLGRTDVLGALPTIFVETPAVGDSLHGSLRLSGTANVYEARFRAQLVDAGGHVLLDQAVHATGGSGTWGTFAATFQFSAAGTTTSTLRVYAVSMQDVLPIDEVDLPAGP